MTKQTKVLSAVAGVALFAMAAAAQAEPVFRIPVSDLNLDSQQGRAVFKTRVEDASRKACANYLELRAYAACRRAFRDEADENLHDQQTRIARASAVTVAVAERP